MTESIPSLTRAVRKRLLRSQQAFAEMVGVSLTAIRHWEKGRNRPRPENLEKIAKLTADAHLAERLHWHAEHYEWHPGEDDQTVINSQEAQRARCALEIVIQRAPSYGLTGVTEYLEDHADRYSKLRENETATWPSTPGREDATRHRKRQKARR